MIFIIPPEKVKGILLTCGKARARVAFAEMVRTAALMATLVACTAAGGPPPVPEGPFDSGVQAAVDAVFADVGFAEPDDIIAIGQAGDVRAAWLLVDLLRFLQEGSYAEPLREALASVTGVPPDPDGVDWVHYTDVLLAWDIPEPPSYLELKQIPYVRFGDQRWDVFFDPASPLDWRTVSSGGVVRDAIEALVDPPLVPADDGDWLPDDEFVFGVVIDGRAAAYPKRILEVHELVNASLGDRRFALPYCSLCGTATAWFTDDQGTPEPLELRTSGLLQRSNKLMYDVASESLIDQFDGEALTGPLRARGVRLTQIDVTLATWGDWKAAHPNTAIVEQGAGRGRRYVPDPLLGRDDAGPIFPVGAIDPRLPSTDEVLGVIGPDGAAVAFHVERARAQLANGRPVILGDVEVIANGTGLSARLAGTEQPIVTQVARWFAWSQFHPDTLLWPADA